MKLLKTKNSAFIVSLVVFVFSILSSISWATTYYVDTNGSNSSGDGSQDNPWQTLSNACSQVTNSGDIIYINPGNYTDNMRCILAVGVNITGAGKNAVTINSSYSGYSYIVARSDVLTDGNHEISGFTIKGGSSPTNRVLDHGIEIIRRNNILIHNVKFQYMECPYDDYDAGALTIFSDRSWDFNNEVTPAEWLTNVCIHDCEFYDCARHGPGSNNRGALHLDAVKDLEIYNCTFDESNTDGQNIKAVFGWLNNISIHDNTFIVADHSVQRVSVFVIELWNVCNDSEIYNNKFYTGSISINSGQKLDGTYSLTFHDNEIYNSTISEYSIDDIVIYNNYFNGGPEGNWGCGVGIWTTLYSAKDEIHNFIVRNNVFENCNSTSIFITDHTDSRSAHFNGVKIYNNVFDGVSNVLWGGNGITILCNTAPSNYENIEIKNNIFMNTDGRGISVWGDNVTGINNLEITNNCFYNIISSNIYDAGTTNPVVSDNFSEQPDINGYGSKPDQYYRSSGPDANIVDAGVDVGIPYSGSAPDIGAYEFEIEPPSEITVSDVTEDNGHQLKIIWTLSPDDDIITNYNIYRSRNTELTEPLALESFDSLNALIEAEEQYTILIGSVEAGINTYTDSSVPLNGATYYYWLSAVKINTESEKVAASSEIITQVDDNTPLEFGLQVPYPNPFNPSTTISFSIPRTDNVELVVYNITGAKIRSLISDTVSAGHHTITWDGNDMGGRQVAAGIYLIRMRSNAFVATQKMMFMK